MREILASRISRGHFFLAVFFRVTHDGLSERGTTRSLLAVRQESFSLGPGDRFVPSSPARQGLVRATNKDNFSHEPHSRSLRFVPL